nr:protein FAR-RED elongated hypocotyl 1 [Tanacetum cinerariifolium]
YTTKQLEQDELLEDLFCSDGVVVPNNFVLSSGRWNIIQDTEQGTEKLTIDKEFEQYFSMLML